MRFSLVRVGEQRNQTALPINIAETFGHTLHETCMAKIFILQKRREARCPKRLRHMPCDFAIFPGTGDEDNALRNPFL